MTTLAIDTSCDETAVAVTESTKVLSNVLWSQASLHSEYGGVFPALAKRAHEERINWVIEKALKKAFPKSQLTYDQLLTTKIDAVAVTVGPGLAIALEVGIKKAKDLAQKYNKPFIPVNHVEGHLLSPLAEPKSSKSESGNSKNKISKIDINELSFPILGLVASGKHADVILIKNIGDYEILAHTIDDAVGEALDKAARMLGLGYPGGAVLEKLARNGNPKSYNLPLPMAGQEDRMEFSYSGLKTAMYKLVEQEKPLTKEKIENLAASFQEMAFKHLTRIVSRSLDTHKVKDFFLGGGVSANTELRKRLRKICNERGITIRLPYSKNLCGDNAAMIGIVAGFKLEKGEYLEPNELKNIDRVPRLKITEKI